MSTIAIIGGNKNFYGYLLKILKAANVKLELLRKCKVNNESCYDYIVINSNTMNKDVVLQSKYCFINMDFIGNINNNIKIHGNIITYGLGSKNTVTISSIMDKNSFVYCLQRDVSYNKASVLEPEEIPIKMGFSDDEELYAAMVAITITLLEKKCINKLNEVEKV